MTGQERAVALHAGGLSYSRIAAMLGVSATTVRRWVMPGVNERHLRQSREAKRRRTGVCATCGGPTRYSGGSGADSVSRTCQRCNAIASGELQRQRAGQGPMQQQLYTLLADRGPLRFVEIRAELGLSSGYVAAFLDRERKTGRIVRVRRGVYRMPT
jgi:hypothetical protein